MTFIDYPRYTRTYLMNVRRVISCPFQTGLPINLTLLDISIRPVPIAQDVRWITKLLSTVFDISIELIFLKIERVYSH